jgi:hypothetical protein
MSFIGGNIMPAFTSEYFYYNPAFDVVASKCSGTVTADNQLAQGIGTYIKKENNKLKAYSGGEELLAVDINNAEDVVHLARAFCDFCSVNHYPAKRQLQSLVFSYVNA